MYNIVWEWQVQISAPRRKYDSPLSLKAAMFFCILFQ